MVALLSESSLLCKCINKAGKKISQILDLRGVCFPCSEQLVQVVWLLPGNSQRTKSLPEGVKRFPLEKVETPSWVLEMRWSTERAPVFRALWLFLQGVVNLQVTATLRRHVPVLMRGFNESCGAARGLLLAVSTAVPQTVACGESANTCSYTTSPHTLSRTICVAMCCNKSTLLNQLNARYCHNTCVLGNWYGHFSFEMARRLLCWDCRAL